MDEQNPYLATIDNENRDNLRQSLQVSVDKQPDTEAKLQQLATRYNLPVDTVRDDQPTIERRLKLDSLDYDTLINRLPATRLLLSDPKKAALAHDDVDNLSAIEQTLKYGKNATSALGSGFFAMGEGLAGVAENIADIHNKYFDGADGNPYADKLGTPIADMIHKVRKNQSDWRNYLTPKADNAFESGVYSGLQSIPAMGSAVLTGNPQAMLQSMMLMTAGQSAAHAKDKGFDPLTAGLYGAADGGIEGFTEKMGAGQLFTDLKAGSSVVKTLINQFVPDGLGEQAATVLQDFNEWSVLNKDKPLQDYLDERPGAAAQTLIATLIGSGGMAAIAKTAQGLSDFGVAASQKADSHALNLEQLNKLAAASKVINRSSATMKSFVDAAIENGPVQDLYIDARTFAQSGVAEQLSAVLPNVAAQVPGALAIGGEIRIPVSDYVTHIAGTEYAQALTDHLRIEGEEFSRAEAQTYMQTHAEETQQAVEKTLARDLEADSFAASKAAVRTTVLNQLNALNRFTETKNGHDATLAAAYYATHAAKLGITPEQMHEKIPLSFAAENVGGKVFGQSNKIDEDTGLPLNNDGTVTVYHHTSKENAALIKATGILKANAEPDVYVTTRKETDTGYGDTAVAIKINPSQLIMDDEFPDGRVDYRIDAKKPGGSVKVGIDTEALYQVSNTQSQLDNLHALEQQQPITLDDATLSELSGAVLRKEVSSRYNAKKLKSETTIDGRVVKFTGVGLREVRQHSADRKVLDLLDKSHEVIQTAIPLWSEDHTQDNPSDSVRAWHYYGAKVALDGQEYFARLVLREDVNGTIYYDNDLSTIESISGHIGDASPTKTGAATVSADDRSISRWFQAVKSGHLYQQQFGSFNPATNTIAIFKNGNLSTVLHELGHFFFENNITLASELLGKTEQLTPGEQSIVDDVSAMLTWHGLQGNEHDQIHQWNSMDFEQRRVLHERTAEAFEAYLLTGKAPSIELHSAFQNFARWMTEVYKSITAFLDNHPEAGKLNDDVRAIFDRMLATDEEIKLAEQGRSMMPLFENAKDAGFTEAEFAAYQLQGVDATNTAKEELRTRGVRDMEWAQGARDKSLKAMQKKHDVLRRELSDRVRKEILAQPIYQAYGFLTRKLSAENTANPEDLESGRLDLTDLSAMGLSEDIINLMVNLKVTADVGLNPDFVADLFGFSSGAELVNALATAENPKAAIVKMTDSMMIQEYGDLATPEAIEQAADLAVHNEVRARFVTTEANALAKATGSLRLLGTAAKEYAAAMIGRLKIRDVKPSDYARAEAKAARAAIKASKQGDIAQAATEKRNQVINIHAVKAAHEAQEAVDTGIRRLNRLQKDGAQKNMRGESLAQLNALMARFDLRTSPSLKEIDAAKVPLAQWIAEESDRLSAVMPDLPGFMLDENYRKHYKDLTVDEFRGLMDGIKQLELLARREQKQYLAIRQQSFDEERESVLSVLRANYPDAFDQFGAPVGPPPSFVPTLSKALSDLGDGVVGEFLNAENIVDLLEYGKTGAVFESLFSRLTHGSDWKAERLAVIYKQLKPLFNAYTLKEKLSFSRAGIAIGAIGTSITRENAVMVALLSGNVEGRDRLANYGWGAPAINAITAHLTEKDINLVEGIWELFDHSLWPELESLNNRTRGKSPPKVIAVPYVINGRPVTGGYMRLKYDTNLDERTHRLDEGAAVRELLGGGMGMSSKTNQGSSNERVQAVKLRPRLDLGVFSEAISETVHDLAYREAIADTMRMLNDHGIQNAIKSAQGIPAYRALVTRVREVAAPPRNPSGFIEKSLSIARKNTVVAMMSGVYTALQNFTGLAPAMAKVSPALLAREVGAFYSPKMMKRLNFCMEQSAYMRGRFNNFDRDLQDMTRQLTVGGNILPSDSVFLGLMGIVDRGVAVPVWNAAFTDGMQKFENDNIRATDYADHIVRQTQGSGRDVDLAQIMAGHGAWGHLKKVFTMFQSYFNAQLGLLVTAGAISKHEAKTNPVLASAKFSGQFVAIIALPVILTDLLMNGLPGDDDDPEKETERWAKAFLRYGAAMFPLVRDVTAGAMSVYAPDGRYNSGFKLSPIESAVETAIKAPGSIYDIFSGEGTDSDTRTAIMGTSVAFHLPGKLISDTVRGTNAWLSGEAGPQAVILGPPRKH